MRCHSIFFLSFFSAATLASASSAPPCDSAYVVKRGNVWTVHPTGLDDTDNLACAFGEAVAAGSGSVVKMTAAEYFLSRPIAVLYEGDLTWRGAGKGRTIITAGSDDAQFPLLVEDGYFPEPGSPSVLVFHQDADGWVSPSGETLTSHLCFRGFTLRLRGLSEPWEDAYGTVSQTRSIIDVTGRIDGLRNFEPSRVRVSANHIRLQGEACSDEACGFLDWTAHNGLTVWGEAVTKLDEEGRSWIEYSKPLVADTEIAHCVFERIGFAAGHSDAEASRLEVRDNRFADVGAAYFLQDANGGRVELNRNRMSVIAYWGVIVTHGLTGVFGYDLGPIPERFPTAPTELEITKNAIDCVLEYAECVVIEDYTVLDLPDTERMLEARVAENHIRITAPAYAGIGSYYSRGVEVLRNIITGEGSAGVYTLYGEDWTIRGNLVKTRSGIPVWLGESSSGSVVDRNLILGRGGDAAIRIDGAHHVASGNFVRQYRPGVAHYWLTASSAENELVVGKADTVQDDGTDNTVTVDGPPGR